MPERRIYRVNYGYRSLIDWAPTAQISSSNSGLSRNNSSQLTGPFVYPDQKGRPLESQLSGRTNIPGHRGLFWDIYYWDRPSIVASKDKGITRDEVLRNMDTLAQQWIYLAAENANIHMTKTFDSMKEDAAMSAFEDKFMNDEEYEVNLDDFDNEIDELNNEQKNISTFFGNNDKALGAEGLASFWSDNSDRRGSSYPNMFRNIKEKSYIGLPSLSKAASSFNYETINKQRVRTQTFDPYTVSNKVKPKEMPMQLQKMVQGVTNTSSWLSQWSTSLQRSGTQGVEAMHDIVVNFMQEQFDAGNISESELGVIIGDDDPNIYEESEPLPPGQSRGATIQERFVVESGLGISPEDAQVPQHVAVSISKPIDVQLHDPVQVGGLHITQFDLTTSMYQAQTGHHGTPTFVSDAVSAATSVMTLEAAISDDYNDPGGLIDSYNNLIDVLMNSPLVQGATGDRTMGGVRSQVRQMGSKHLRTKAGREKVTSDNQFAAGQVLEIARQQVGSTSASAVLDMTNEELITSLGWVLHFMGQQDKEDFGNLMRVALPDGSMGTLIVAFDIDSNNRFSRAHIEIDAGVLPIEWLYNLTFMELAGIRLGEFIEICNAGHATGALEGTVVEGVFAKFAAVGASNFQPRIGWAKISSAKFSAVLESVVNFLFDHIRDEMQGNIKDELHQEATRFSKAAREPSNLGAIPEWYRYAFEEMTGSSSPSLGSDPFWYLWAAPYISSEWPQFGGGKQQNVD